MYRKLRRVRIGRDMTQTELADAVGVTNAAICKIEAMTRGPSIDVALKLEEYFGIPVAELMAEDNDTT